MTGICPQIYGNDELPVFVKNEEYDDSKVYIAVKNEIYNVYPPVGHTVVFSLDTASAVLTLSHEE